MSKRIFDEKEIEVLKRNPNVKKVSSKSITYKNEFKKLFIQEYELGKSPDEIFEENGFDSEILGQKRISSSTDRWKVAYKKSGILGLEDGREISGGRPVNRELTLEEKLERAEATILFQEKEIELLKKLDLKERSVRRSLKANEIFEIINEIIIKNQLKGMVSFLCESAGVSRSGYYTYWNIKAIGARLLREEKELSRLKEIKKVFEDKDGKIGSKQIKMILENDKGISYNLKSIKRIMKKYNLVCKIRKGKLYAKQMKATKEHRTYNNILNREFRHSDVNKTLLTDITYLKVRNKLYYLSVIMDSNTSEILAHVVSNNLRIDFVLETTKQLEYHSLHKDVLIHSDQGSHYSSPKFSQLVQSMGIKQSMSRKGNCWDNAPMESFFGHMKDELSLEFCDNLRNLREEIKRYIIYYNNCRYQWNRKKMTPVQYRNHLIQDNPFSKLSLT